MLYCDAITDAMTKGLGQQKHCVRYNIITSAMDVALLFVLLPRFGMDGYFISFLITHLLNFLLSLRRLLKITNIRIPFHAPAFMAAAFTVSSAGASLATNTLWRIISFLLMFFCILTLLRMISKKDALWLRGLIYKQ